MGIKIKGSAPYQRLNNEGSLEKYSPNKKQLLFRFFVVKPLKWIKSVFGVKDKPKGKPAPEYLRMTGKILGEGAFGCVEKVETQGEVRAYKNIQRVTPNSIDREKNFTKEASVLQRLQHPHIIKSLGNPETKEVIAIRTHDLSDPEISEPSDEDWVVVDSVKSQKAGLQMEVAEADLREKMQSLDKTERLRQALNLLSAVNHMHQQGVCYLDIKPDNLLWLDGKAVCADFDSSIESDSSVSALITQHVTETIGITEDYASPELYELGQKQRNEPVEGFLCDSWAMGCTLAELITGERIFHRGKDCKKPSFQYVAKFPPHERLPEYRRVRLAEYFSQHEKTLGEKVARILKALLAVNPGERMTIQEALEQFPVAL